MAVVDILSTVVSEVEAGRRVAVCVIVATRGSTPQPVGTIVCVDESAAMHGTLGGGCVEADIRKRAHGLLGAAGSGGGELITVELDHDFGYDDGMICGGQMDVAMAVLSSSTDLSPYRTAIDRLRTGQAASLPIRVESKGERVEYRVRLEAEPKLLIVGGGHISRVLAPMVAQIGFRVCVLDDRADYANADRYVSPIDTHVGDIAVTLRDWPIDANTYIVIVTRGHKHDEAALQAVVGSSARYIGMIGSRRKIAVVFDDLRQAGTTGEQLANVHAPVGLSINAVTAEEIAVSIAAELVSVRRSERRERVEGPFPVDGD